MSYTAEQMYRDLYSKTTEQIVELMIATGINPELGYYENESATLFDMGALHLMNRLDGADFSRVMNRIGDIAVQIAVAGAHRAEPFAACRWVIDELKARVPIWKKEVTDDGEEWLGSTP